MTKVTALAKINREIMRCRICRQDSIGLPVPGEGSAYARVAFIGEAPGKTEARMGRPFVGRSGKFLRTHIAKTGLRESDIYITSPVKYLPKRGTPTPQQIKHGRKHFLKQLEIIKPKVIVLMGRVAALGALNEPIAVSKLHGQSKVINSQTYFFMYHPAAAVRFGKLRARFAQDFKKFKQLLKNL